MNLVSGIIDSGFFAQSALSAEVATKDSLGRNISETYLTGIPADYATTNYVDSSVSGKYDTSSFSAISGNFLTAHQSLPQSADWNSAASTVSAGYVNWDASYGTLTANSANWDSTYTTVSNNSASWTGGATPTYNYTTNGLISAIDSSGLYAQGLHSGSNIGRNIVWDGIGTATGGNRMWLNPGKTPFAITSGIFGPLYYATGATIAYGSSGSPAPDNGQIFGGFFKGNEWYVSNATAGQALRGETHQSRGVHISGADTAGHGFNLGILSVSGVNSTGSWKYGYQEDAALRAVSSCDMHESAFGYDASNNITAYNGSAFKAGDEFPQSATEAIEVVTGGSANWNSTTTTVSTNSGAWGGQGIEISAGFGIDIQLVDNKLLISLATATGDI